MTSETWKPVPGWKNAYEVSDLGNVRKTTGEVVGQWRNDRGYMLVRLSGPRRQLSVHRLVASVFISNPRNHPTVNHMNNERADNRACNLEWCTQAENLRHAEIQGRMQHDYWVGRRSPNAILSDPQVLEIRNAHRGGESYAEIGARFGISKRAVGRCINKETYANV